MFEKLKKYLDEGKNMLEQAFDLPEEDDFETVPEGVTCEQLIEEAKEYVDAIIVPKHGHHAEDQTNADTDENKDNNSEQNVDKQEE